MERTDGKPTNKAPAAVTTTEALKKGQFGVEMLSMNGVVSQPEKEQLWGLLLWQWIRSYLLPDGSRVNRLQLRWL